MRGSTLVVALALALAVTPCLPADEAISGGDLARQLEALRRQIEDQSYALERLQKRIDDVVAARDWALATYPFCDAARVGILGWSHGGLIALMAAFDHPDKFRVAYAGVPVSDLVARLGYLTGDYRELFSAPYHIGKPVDEAVDEYRHRSPVTHVAKLRIPLLVHTTTNDRDVNVLEVENLITALKAAGKTFEHKVYEDAPGGHSFNRMDSALARKSRAEFYRFLAKHLGK